MKKNTNCSKLLVFLFPVILYVIFFLPVMNFDKIIGGPDAVRYSFPARHYLWESIKEGRYPFWTERIFGGYPIYTDSEHAYTSVINILSIIIFGPFNSYKLLHFAFYYAGSLGLIFLLKRKNIDLISSLSAVVVYYFSFFLLYHQQHFSMTLTAYLLPLSIYITDRMINEKNIYFSFVLAFLTGVAISFGSYQMVFLLILTICLYSITQIDLRNMRKYLPIILVYIAATFLISLPRLLPTYQSYLRGNRYNNGITYTDGSYNPLMVVNLIYPYIFGYGKDYKWNTVSSDYQIHETYIYVGVTSAIVGLFGYFLIKDPKLKKFINLCVLAFLILGFINYLPFINNLNIPVVSSFRFWGRSVILLVFSLSISVAYFMNNPNITKNTRAPKNFSIILVPLIYLVQLTYSFFRDKKSSIIIQQVKNRAIQFDNQFYIWLILLFLTLFAVLLVLFIKKGAGLLIKYFLFIVITFDLFYFGHNIVKKYDENIDSLYNKNVVEVSKEYENRRIAIFSKDTEYNLGLYLKSWGVLGYSQYNPTVRTKLTKTMGFKETSKQWNSEIDLTQLDKLGLVGVIGSDGVIKKEFDVHSSLQNYDGTTLKEEALEGKYYFKIKSNSPQRINTFINNHPGWVIKINGSVYKNEDTENTFLAFDVPSGDVDVVIKFVPKIFYFSILASFIGMVFLCLFVKKRYRISH